MAVLHEAMALVAEIRPSDANLGDQIRRAKERIKDAALKSKDHLLKTRGQAPPCQRGRKRSWHLTCR
jgi:hypothetical protein